jgi:hypothetical protein
MSEFGQVVKEGAQEVGRKAVWGIRRILLFALVLGVLAGGIYLLWSNYTYSEGTRTGYLIKISRKGVLLKTFEGQLNLGGFQQPGQPAVMGNIWEFSVRDRAVFEKLQQVEGKQVTLFYKEKIRAMPWQGDTNYFVYAVEPVR